MRWYEVVSGLYGLGSLALVGLLVWMLQRLRNDLSKREDDLVREKDAKVAAENAVNQANHLIRLAERNSEHDKKALDDLKASLSASKDEALKELATTKEQLEVIERKVREALNLAGRGTAKFWAHSTALSNSCVADYGQLISKSIPILIFGNQKGGVGKSTTATNLAAAFAAKGERVLMVDLDYQGSQSMLGQLQLGDAREPESLVDFLFQENLDPNWSKLAVRKIAHNLFDVPAFYTFEVIERKLEYEWALGLSRDDVRFRLARALLSKYAQEEFDRIIIDGPPRLTLGFVNGFCAATHIYIPTVVDAVSTYAVTNFCDKFNQLRPTLNPSIRLGGIVGTMTFTNSRDPLTLPQNADNDADFAERAAQNALKTQEKLFIRYPVIRRDAALAHASEKGIAYLHEPTVRPMFDALAAVVANKAPSRRTNQ